MNGNIGVAVLGCGYWGINYVRVFSQLPGARVVVACDQRPERLAEVQKQVPGVAVTDSVEAMLATPGVDAVVVCTPATGHFAVTSQCIAAGKHILVEKPIATTSAECDELIRLAAAKQVLLMVGHTFVYNAGVRKVKEYLDADEIGNVYYLYSRRTNLGPIRHDVNALWDLAPHDISIFNYLLDSVPEWVSAVGARVLQNGREDVGFISLGYPDGVVAHVHVSWADPHKVREVVVVGSEKRIVFNDLLTPEQVKVFEKGIAPAQPEAPSYGEYHFTVRDGAIISPRVDVSEPLKNQSLHFLECIATGQKPITDGVAGRDVVAVLEAIDRSIARQGAPVDVEWGRLYDYSARRIAPALRETAN